MAFFSSIFKRFKRDAGTSGDNVPRTPRHGYSLEFPTQGSLSVAAVYRCVNVLADAVAKLPMECRQRKGEVMCDNPGNPLHYLLNVEPCAWLSGHDMKKRIVQCLLLRGNAYVMPVLSAVKPEIESLILLDPLCVAHDTLNNLYRVNDPEAGIAGTFSEDEIIHLKNFSIDGKKGLSTLSFARVSLEIASKGDKETLKRFTTGGNVRGILSNGDAGIVGVGEVQDDQLDKLALDIDDKFSSGQNIVATHGQAHLTQLSMSSADMQFLESRKFGVLDICRFFGVPPMFVFSDTSSNYKSAEMANLSFYSDTLGPLLKGIENELNRKLIGRGWYGKKDIVFNISQLHAMDLATQARYRAQLLGTGYSINEIRKLDNLAPVEGGDTVLVSANYKTIEMLDNEAQKQQSNENS